MGFVCQRIIYNNNNNDNIEFIVFLQTQSTLQFNYIKTFYYSVRHLFHFAKKIKKKSQDLQDLLQLWLLLIITVYYIMEIKFVFFLLGSPVSFC